MSLFQDALDDAKKDLTVAAEASGSSVSGTASDAVESTVAGFLKDREDLPAVANALTDGNLKTVANRVLKNTAALFEAQAAEAVRELSTLSVEAAERGTTIVNKMIELAELVANRRLSSESAEYATTQYVEALKLLAKQTENRTKVIAYNKARAALLTAKSLLFTGVKIAMQVGLKAATGYIGGLNLPTKPV